MNTHQIQTTTGETVTVETAFSEDAQFWTGEGWQAAHNSFDIDCHCQSGKTEMEAITHLLDMLDMEAIV